MVLLLRLTTNFACITRMGTPATISLLPKFTKMQGNVFILSLQSKKDGMKLRSRSSSANTIGCIPMRSGLMQTRTKDRDAEPSVSLVWHSLWRLQSRKSHVNSIIMLSKCMEPSFRTVSTQAKRTTSGNAMEGSSLAADWTIYTSNGMEG